MAVIAILLNLLLHNTFDQNSQFLYIAKAAKKATKRERNPI